MNATSHFGLLAEFGSAELLLKAVRDTRQAGYSSVEAFSPFPVEGLADALGFKRNCVPLVTLLGGIIGGAATYFMLWYSAVISYPYDSGARPLNSWPAFIPPTFELTILGAALAAFFAFLIASGLPRLNHPIFNAPDFDLASRNRFFLCIRCDDPKFDADQTRQFLANLEPMRVVDVPA
jgi:ActD protein